MNLEQLIRESTDGMVTIPCTDCEKPITRTKSVMQTSLRRNQTRFFCSNECKKSNNLKLRMRNCEHCEALFESKYKGHKYCSSACAAIVNNSLYIKRGDGGTKKLVVYVSKNGKPYYGKKKPNKCPKCGELFNKVCTPACERHKKVDLWLRGEIPGMNAYTLATFAREYIFNRDNHQCTECGFSGSNPVTGNSILHVDHIDGNWENSSEDNLRLLCPNCHAMTENFGALNMGKGRKWKENYSQF